MLEMLLNSSSNNYYPNSGPGSKKLLVGDKNLGFFGLVTEEEMSGISDTLFEFAKAAAPTKLPSRYKIARWSKMFFREKVYFFPEKPIAYGFSTYDIIQAKMFRGDDKTFAITFSAAPGTSPVQDLRVVINEGAKKWKLIPRLLRSDRTSNSEMANELGSETNLLLNTVHGVRSNAFTNHPSFRAITFIADEGPYLNTGQPPYITSDLSVDYVTSAGTNQLNVPFAVLANPNGTLENLYYRTSAEGTSLAIYWRPVLVLEGAADDGYSYLLPISSVAATANIDMLPQAISYLTASGLSRLVLDPPTVSNALYPQGGYTFSTPAYKIRAVSVKSLYATPLPMNAISSEIGMTEVKRIVSDYLPRNSVTSQASILTTVSGVKETEPAAMNTQGEPIGESIRPYLLPQNKTSLVVSKCVGYEQTDARYYRAYMLEPVSTARDLRGVGSTNMDVRYYRAFMSEPVSTAVTKATGYGRVN